MWNDISFNCVNYKYYRYLIMIMKNINYLPITEYLVFI